MSFTDLSPLSSPVGFLSGTPTGTGGENGFLRTSLAVSPPRGFKPLNGPVSEVRFGGRVPVPRGGTAAQKAGRHYEQRVQDVLQEIYVDKFRASPSILYRDKKSRLRRAIPDGLLDVGNYLLVIEIKLTHTEKAWWQLERLYAPLVQHLFLNRRILLVEICRSYDPTIQFPLPHERITSLHAPSIPHVGVLQWRI